VEDETAYLGARGDAARLSALAAQIAGTVDAMTLRDVEARLVEAQASSDPAAALSRAVRLLKAGTADDAAERVAEALDKPDLLARLAPADRALVGEAARSHRLFDRAVEILEAARPALPARRDELVFSIGRARFGQERYEEAEKIYLEGAAGSRDPEQKAVFLFHAATGAAVIVLRSTRPDAPRPYRVWGYPVLPLVVVISALAFVANALVEKPRESGIGIALLALGLPAYLWWRRKEAA
jgi:tetratricopeptide (TPR) repeat protein